MQALYCDGHAKATKFSQTLGTNNDDQQWTFLSWRYNNVKIARQLLQNPKTFAMMD
jgi:hypothetical protein